MSKLLKTLNCISSCQQLNLDKINSSAFSFLFISNNNELKFVVYLNRNSILLRKYIIYVYRGSISFKNYYNFITKIQIGTQPYLNFPLIYFRKLYMVGLGFKNFVFGKELHILVGNCNYILIQIPENVKLFCRKNQIFLLGSNSVELYDFVSNLKKIKNPNFYKGKGILEFKNFKFMKLKVGKKQRYT